MVFGKQIFKKLLTQFVGDSFWNSFCVFLENSFVNFFVYTCEKCNGNRHWKLSTSFIQKPTWRFFLGIFQEIFGNFFVFSFEFFFREFPCKSNKKCRFKISSWKLQSHLQKILKVQLRFSDYTKDFSEIFPKKNLIAFQRKIEMSKKFTKKVPKEFP